MRLEVGGLARCTLLTHNNEDWYNKIVVITKVYEEFRTVYKNEVVDYDCDIISFDGETRTLSTYWLANYPSRKRRN